MITIGSRLKITAAFLALLLAAVLLLPLAAEAAVTITEYGGPAAGSGLGGITAGPDGALWFTEYHANKIGRITTAGVVTEYAASGNPQGITTGPDGALWFTEAGGIKIGRITTAGVVTEYAASGNYFGITSGPDGALWYTEASASKIGRITTGGAVTEYGGLTPGWPMAITTGPDGALWFAEYSSNKIGRIDPTTHAVTEYGGLTAGGNPWGISSGPDGALWFTEVSGNKIGRITTGGVVTEYAASGSPQGITTGPDGALWFTENGGNKIGRIDPTTHAITQYGGLTASSQPIDITCGGDGALWFTENNASKIGRVSGIPVPQRTWTNMGGAVSTLQTSALAYDSTHSFLYAGTWTDGVWKYDGATWADTGGGLSSEHIRCLAYDSMHNFLYAGTDDGVWKYNGTTWAYTAGGVSSFEVKSLAYDATHNFLYGGTYYHGVWKYDGTTWADTAGGVSSYDIESLAYDATHNLLYAGTYNYGVWKYNGTTWSDTAVGVSSHNWILAYDSMHNVLYGATYYQGVWKYNGTTWTDTGGGLSSYDTKSLACDATRNLLYAGTANHGVWKYNGTTWINTGGGVSSHNIISLACDATHNILYAGPWDVTGVWKYGESTSATPTSYMGEGTTAWGFSTYISIENPNTTAVHADITYNTSSGSVSGGTLTLPAKSQTTVNPADKLGNKDFSTKVTCTEGKTIVVDRTMSWNKDNQGEEAHSSVGVTSPAKTWYLAEGSSAWNFECWLLIQNPNSSVAHCQVTYMIEGAGPTTVNHDVPANSRASFDMSKDIGSKDASIKVVADVPVIPERAMYRNNRREGHDSIGTTAPANDFYLAEGATGYNVGYITYVLVQNPNDSPSDVSVTYMTQSGQVAGPSFQMPANSRKTIKVNDQLPPNSDVSTKVHGSKPIIAERAMYWNNGTGEACHDSIGMSSAHTTFYLPDGETSNGRETWTLVQNPNASAVTVEVSYLKAGGGAVTLSTSIPANSRKTFNMADKIPSGRASIMVTSKTSGKKIMCERAMYWNSRGAGTDTIGGFSD